MEVVHGVDWWGLDAETQGRYLGWALAKNRGTLKGHTLTPSPEHPTTKAPDAKAGPPAPAPDPSGIMAFLTSAVES